MIDIIILTIVVILLMILFFVVKRAFFASYYDKCYEDMKNRGDTIFGTCCGQSGGDKYTDYLSYSCIDCPYYFNAISSEKEKEKENESTSNPDDRE